MTDPAARLVWRIPSYQPALLMLVLCAAAALNIYGHPSAMLRIVTLLLGLLCGGLAIAGLRLQLVADPDGLSVRKLIGEVWVPWQDVADVEVITHSRGAATLRVSRTDGTYVDVPPALLQPTKPTSKQRVHGQLDQMARQLRARRRSVS